MSLIRRKLLEVSDVVGGRELGRSLIGQAEKISKIFFSFFLSRRFVSRDSFLRSQPLLQRPEQKAIDFTSTISPEFNQKVKGFSDAASSQISNLLSGIQLDVSLEQKRVQSLLQDMQNTANQIDSYAKERKVIDRGKLLKLQRLVYLSIGFVSLALATTVIFFRKYAGPGNIRLHE